MLLPQAQGLFVFQLTSLNKRDIVVYRESSRRTRAWRCGEAVYVISVRSLWHLGHSCICICSSGELPYRPLEEYRRAPMKTPPLLS